MNCQKTKTIWTGKNGIFLIAEIGVNHEGQFEVASNLIKLAKQAGVDAVKFQTYDTFHYISVSQKERFERTKSFELSQDEFKRLSIIAEDQKILFLSTPFDTGSVDFLDTIVPFFKISSGDLTNRELIKRIAKKKKPIILSTGLAVDIEIEKALQWIEEEVDSDFLRKNVILLHCVSSYPAPIDQANLLSIPYLKKRFGLPVGYSDHTMGIQACLTAVALGAVVIEKHFTDKKENRSFRDHAISADPSDMNLLVDGVKDIKASLGMYGNERLACERDNLLAMRRGLIATMDLEKGIVLSHDMITTARPAEGIDISKIDKVLGQKLLKDIYAGCPIKDDCIRWE
ncbi:MAG: hypothetical protein HOF76_12090 [Candidatus Scalindua sp.]|jgi:N,N'-diacetyllegionaminate synthase|nr:hypothetical protein [Candidatus Scalindua sp.]MBT6045482.1 hypothetical protein [Candidatus Scalindua sp.]